MMKPSPGIWWKRYEEHLGNCRICRGLTDQDPETCKDAKKILEGYGKSQEDEGELYYKDGRGVSHVLPPGSDYTTACGLDVGTGPVPIHEPHDPRCRVCFEGRE